MSAERQRWTWVEASKQEQFHPIPRGALDGRHDDDDGVDDDDDDHDHDHHHHRMNDRVLV